MNGCFFLVQMKVCVKERSRRKRKVTLLLWCYMFYINCILPQYCTYSIQYDYMQCLLNVYCQWGCKNQGHRGYIGRWMDAEGIRLGKPSEYIYLSCIVWLPAIFWFLSQLRWVFKLRMRGEERRGEVVYGSCCMLKQHFSISRRVTSAAADQLWC